jgi:hypothetical protein
LKTIVAAMTAASFACAVGATPGAGLPNPASSQFTTDADARLRVGILDSLGFRLEMGPVDHFADEVERLIDELDREDISLSEGTQLVDHFNALLPQIGRDAYVKVEGNLALPMLPIRMRVGQGVYSIDANVALQARLGILDAPLTFNTLSEELETPTSAYVKAAKVTGLGFGFSRPVWAKDGRNLVVGSQVRYLRASLSKQLIALESAEDADEAVDIARDSYDANQHSSHGISLDVGAIYDSPHYHLGLTLANLTEPEFEYGPLGVDCGSQQGDAQFNCYTAVYFADRIALRETWTLERLATLDGGWRFAGGAGHLSARVDLNDVHDPVGDLAQHAQVTLAYQTRTPWLPDLRAGYRRNLAGTQLASASLGVSFFQLVHLDLDCGLEDTLIDGRAVPRSVGFNLGFHWNY